MQVSRRLWSTSVLAALLISACAAPAASPTAPPASAPPAGESAAPEPSPTEAAQPGGPITVRIAGDWNSLDPWELLNQSSAAIAPAIYDQLVGFVDGQLVPYVATAWEQTPESITFTIRDDVVCSDGEPLTPSVIKAHFDRIFDPAAPSSSVARFFGPGPFTVTADDAAGTLTWETATPFTDALSGFAAGGGSNANIACTASTTNPAGINDNPVGSGPYTLAEKVQGDHLTLTLRPEWTWGPNGVTAAALPSQITYQNIENETTVANLLLTGGIDVGFVRGPDVERLAADPSLTRKDAPVTSIDQMIFQQGEGHPTVDEALREAIMTAVDPDAWNQAAWNGQGARSSSFVAEGADCFEPATADLVPTPSVDAARQVLLDNGYTAGADGTIQKDGQPVAIQLLGHVAQNSGPDYLLDVLTELGLDVTLNKVDLGTFSTTYRAGEWDVVVHNTTGSTPNPYGTVALFSGPTPPNGNNFSNIVDDELNATVATAQSSVGDERCDAWMSVQRQVLEKHIFLPMSGQASPWFGRQGYDFSPQSGTLVTPSSLRSPAGG
jgi:peptide/nickel transport system substrate-binding protein